MRVILDNTSCEQIQARSVADAVQAASNLARTRGRSIVDVIVDGENWNADRIESDEAKAVDAVREVRFASADPKLLVCEAFADAADALGEIDRLQQTAAELLQADHGVQAMERLSEAIEMWGSVQQALTMGSAMAEVNLGEFQPAIERLTSELRNVRATLERRDVIALSDILLYDLPDVVHQWRSILHELRERLRSESQGGRQA